VRLAAGLTKKTKSLFYLLAELEGFSTLFHRGTSSCFIRLTSVGGRKLMESSFEYVKGCERKRERSSQSQTAHQSIRHQAVQILSSVMALGLGPHRLNLTQRRP
jgi:hypothetical protein